MTLSRQTEPRAPVGSLPASARSGLALHLVAAVSLAQLALVMVGCSALAPGDQHYTLVSINGDSLPAPYMPIPQAESVWEVTSGALTLHSDTTLTHEFVIRCRPGLDPASCGVANDGRNSVEGVYSREGEWVRFGNQTVPMTFGSNMITIHFGGQTVFGFVPPQNFEFRR